MVSAAANSPHQFLSKTRENCLMRIELLIEAIKAFIRPSKKPHQYLPVNKMHGRNCEGDIAQIFRSLISILKVSGNPISTSQSVLKMGAAVSRSLECVTANIKFLVRSSTNINMTITRSLGS